NSLRHLAAQIDPYSEHCAPRIYVGSGPAEIGTCDVVRHEALLGRAIQDIENVDDKLDAFACSTCDRFRQSNIQQCLRRQPARSARLDEHPLLLRILWHRQQGRSCPRLAAEISEV